MTLRLLRITTPWACFGLTFAKGRIVAPCAPISRWAIGRDVGEAMGYWQERGARIEVLTIHQRSYQAAVLVEGRLEQKG